jgi:hypothetical protein
MNRFRPLTTWGKLITVLHGMVDNIANYTNKGSRGMVYYIPDHIEAFAADDGGIILVEWKGQKARQTHIAPDGCVTLSEASRIVQPPVSRVAVHRWIENGKLKADLVEDKYLIELTELRKFANSEGKAWAKPYPKP